jgi:hypothetical protein
MVQKSPQHLKRLSKNDEDFTPQWGLFSSSRTLLGIHFAEKPNAHIESAAFLKMRSALENAPIRERTLH